MNDRRLPSGGASEAARNAPGAYALQPAGTAMSPSRSFFSEDAKTASRAPSGGRARADKPTRRGWEVASGRGDFVEDRNRMADRLLLRQVPADAARCPRAS